MKKLDLSGEAEVRLSIKNNYSNYRDKWTDNGVGPTGFGFICDMLKKNNALTSLDISCNEWI